MAEKEENYNVLRNGILYFIIAFQVVFFIWIINNILIWSDINVEDNPIIYLLAIPLLVFVFIIPNLGILAMSKVVIRILKMITIAGLIGQLYVYFLLYIELNIPEGSFPSGWLSGNFDPILFGVFWLVISFGMVVPGCVMEIYLSKNSDAQFKQSWHFGALLLGVAMLLRFGGTWSAPLHGLIVTGFVIPFLIGLKSSINPNKEERRSNDRFQQLLFPSCGMLTMMLFWITYEPVYSANALSSSIVWGYSIGANAVLLAMNWTDKQGIQIYNWERKDLKGALLADWCLVLLMSAAAIAMSLHDLIANTLVVWIPLGFIAISLFPEIIVLLKWPREKIRCPEFIRIFFWVLSSLIGIAFPIIVTLYDPISSYLGLILVGFNAVCVVPGFFMKKTR